MRGASALQHVLEQSATLDIEVFVVWEPVLPTDRFAPTTSVLARVADRRARQYWDRGRLVSTGLGDAAGYERGAIVWDFVGLYPPGIRWEATLDAPLWSGAPVVDAADELRAKLISGATSAAEARP